MHVSTRTLSMRKCVIKCSWGMCSNAVCVHSQDGERAGTVCSYRCVHAECAIWGRMSVCVNNQAKHVPGCACSHLHLGEDLCDVCDSLSVCVIRVRKCGCMCHFGQSVKKGNCVRACALRAGCVCACALKHTCSRGEHVCGQVMSHVCMCVAGGGSAWRLGHRCACWHVPVWASERVSLRWPGCLSCRGGPRPEVCHREPVRPPGPKEALCPCHLS